jgi:signal peptidase I
LFKKTQKEKPPKPQETLPESIAGVASVLVSGLFIITFVVQAFEIPSRSMEDTLLVGDHVFVDRLTPAAKAGYVGPFVPYREVHRGDIVVFISPNERGLYVVKRVIGVPGDRIRLRNRTVYVNGAANPEPYVKYIENNYIPPHSYFGMGDDRDLSLDSRYWGFIPQENVIGRPLFIYWSFETPEDQYQHTEIKDRLTFVGHVIIHFFDQTRWKRMFKLVH